MVYYCQKCDGKVEFDADAKEGAEFKCDKCGELIAVISKKKPKINDLTLPKPIGLKVLYDKVLIEPLEGTNITASGIEVIGRKDEDVVKGKVVGVGDQWFDNGIWTDHLVKLGDIVYIQSSFATKLQIKKRRYYVVPEKMIVAVEE